MNYTLKNNHASPRNVKTGGGGLWKKISFLMLCLLVTVQITAQHRPVSGAVIDGNGEPIIGANVIEVGTSNGVITDIMVTIPCRFPHPMRNYKYPTSGISPRNRR